MNDCRVQFHGIERMCANLTWPSLRIDPLAPGLEIATATGMTEPFRPHQHDCYVVGMTFDGVQSFRYRGEQRNAHPGQAFAIHPGETHDGRPGTEYCYGYRAAYVAPDMISDALGISAVPFVREAVGRNINFITALKNLFDISPERPDDIALSDCMSALADAISAMSGRRYRHTVLPDRITALRLRDDLMEHAVTGRSMRDLESEHGLNRFTICRLFRRHFGVSPQTFLINQRVFRARSIIAKRVPLADAASVAGFADQSHMTRQFVKTMGITPGQWRDLSMAGTDWLTP